MKTFSKTSAANARPAHRHTTEREPSPSREPGDVRVDGVAERTLPAPANMRPQAKRLVQLQTDIRGTPRAATRPANRTGMPDDLKSGIETLSGLSMDAVRVHYDSARPAELSALAYAQGMDVHVGPGQEQHLPHEAWHVVQQLQSRVRPTTSAHGIGINDDHALEHEADIMGARALQRPETKGASAAPRAPTTMPRATVVQLEPKVTGQFLEPPTEGYVIPATGRPLKSEAFTIRATLDLVPPNTEYKYGEYRQYVKGAFRSKGVAGTHKLASGPMSETEWREDHIGKDRYGYRVGYNRTAFTNDEGSSDKANGRNLASWDQPSASSDDDEMDLHFRGVLIDKGDGNREFAERHWHVYGRVAPYSDDSDSERDTVTGTHAVQRQEMEDEMLRRLAQPAALPPEMDAFVDLVFSKRRIMEGTPDRLDDAIYALYSAGTAPARGALDLARDDARQHCIDYWQTILQHAHGCECELQTLDVTLAEAVSSAPTDLPTLQKWASKFVYVRVRDAEATYRVYANVGWSSVGRVTATLIALPAVCDFKFAGPGGLGGRSEGVVVYCTDREGAIAVAHELSNAKIYPGRPQMTEAIGTTEGVGIGAEPAPVATGMRTRLKELGTGDFTANQQSFGMIRAEIVASAVLHFQANRALAARLQLSDSELFKRFVGIGLRGWSAALDPTAG